MIQYTIDVSATREHAFTVELSIDSPASGQLVSLPVWIPGSYLVREFARHLSRLTAEQRGRPVGVTPRDKASWVVSCDAGATLVLRYRIHAFDASVRAAWLDDRRGFWNGTSVCLRVEGREREPHRLSIGGLPDGWEVVTSLPRTTALPGYEVTDYDTLVDHPVEIGSPWRGSFDAAGATHTFAVTGALPDFDGDRLLADTRRICESAIALWHGEGGRPPFDASLFLLNAVEDGRGGLEHRASTALVAPRRDLPRHGQVEASDGYVGVLGLVSHEYFHAWNVKRLKPREFAAFDYTRENHSELLWFFEGFTSYYDDLLLVRAGLIGIDRYLKLLAQTMTSVDATPGRGVQSVADASRDAWIKHYRPDENTPNGTVSYYLKGSLVALALDLTLRCEGRGSLDDVLRALWRAGSGGPIEEADIVSALEGVGGRSYAGELASWVHGTAELPLATLLESVGVAVERQPATLAQRIGVRVSESPLTGVKLTHVLAGGLAERAGLAAGDEIVAAGDWRIRRLDDALRCATGSGDGAAVDLLVARDQRLTRRAVSIGAAVQAAGAVRLRQRADADTAVRERCAAWLATG